MILLLAALALLLLSLPAIVRPLGRRIDPRLWAKLCATALASGALLFEAVAVMTVAPFVLRALGHSGLARACARMLGVLSPGGLTVAVLACAVGVAVLGASLRAARRNKRAISRSRIGPGIGRQEPLRPGALLVVLPGSDQLALSVPGRPGQVIATEGLVDALVPEQLEVVYAHETAHLQLGHWRYLLLARVVEQAFRPWPPAAASVRALRLALERWADETAAGKSMAQRGHLREALIQVALGAPQGAELAALSGAAGGLLERLDALEGAPTTASWQSLLFIPGAAIAAVAGVAAIVWSHEAYCAVTMAAHCWSSAHHCLG